MFDCRYCGRYTRLRPCCTSVECTRRNEEYDRHAGREAQERAERRKGGGPWKSDAVRPQPGRTQLLC